MSQDALGDRMKLYEGLTGHHLLPLAPAVARIDGRAFHTFTRGLHRPYDGRLSTLMQATTQHLVEEYDALVGYTQSDEISLLWCQETFKSELPFGGRVQKLVSNLAGSAAAYFNKHLATVIPEKAHRLPGFDARVFSLPTRDEAANYFLWRVRDAEKNSVQMAAQHHFSHAELQGKHGDEQQEMLFTRAGVNWNDYPEFFKRGTFVRRVVSRVPFSPDEVEKLPPKHDARKNPALLVERHVFRVVSVPPFGRVINRVAFLFEGADPATGAAG
jgi:tRNA(His) guanylyltransferase